MSLAIALHVLLVVIWVGGMVFAWAFLRPAAVDILDPPLRLRLWVAVFDKFFPVVWVALVVILVSGFGLVSGIYQGFKGLPMHISIMMALGIIMMMIFMHVYFAPYQRLKKAVAAEDWATGGKNLALIRTMVGINSIIGLLTIAIATAGKYI